MKADDMLKKSKRLLIQKRLLKSWLLMVPSLIGVIVFVVIPFLDIIRRAFLITNGMSKMGFSGFINVWQNLAFRLAIKNTGRFILTGVPLVMFFSLLAALLIHYVNKKVVLYKTILIVPMAIPSAGISLFWKLCFIRNGFFNRIIAVFISILSGFIEIQDYIGTEWINGENAFSVLIFIYIWRNLGYNMLLWLVGLNGISEGVSEAARLDGAHGFSMFRYIILPELYGVMGVIFVLSIVNSFKIYREAYLLAGSYPHESIYMLQHLFNHWFLNMDIQNMSVAAVMISALSLSILVFCYLYSNLRKWSRI